MLKLYFFSSPLRKVYWKFIKPREVGTHDVLIEILYCGVCHTDIHFLNNDLGMTVYPIVPGHEIVGIVRNTGEKVMNFKKGDIAEVEMIDIKNINEAYERMQRNDVRYRFVIDMSTL